MKNIWILFIAILLAGCASVSKHETAQPAQDEISYLDASVFPLFGKAYRGEGPRYRRLPERLHGVVRDPVWRLGCNSAGMYVRFRTNAPEVYAKWTNTGYRMPHMTDCGVGGLDLYAFIDGSWRFVGSAFDWNGAGKTEHERKIVAHMEPQMREYMLYLSLYDEVKGLELGVPKGYTIEQPQMDSPRSDSPIVMYGTSILQGGCASRPGMAHTNILARRLNRTIINLGFSGNALLDLDIAQFMAEVEHPALFVLDYVPNASAERIQENGEKFFRILRGRHPQVPVVFVENPQFSHGIVNQETAENVRKKNTVQKALYQSLLDAGETNIYYVPAQGMTTPEDFVDGTHLTDLGMTHYADHILPILEKTLRQ